MVYLLEEQVAPFITKTLENIKLGIWNARLGLSNVVVDLPTEVAIEATIISQPQAIALVTTTARNGTEAQGGTTTETPGVTQHSTRTTGETSSGSQDTNGSESLKSERDITYESFT